MIDQLRKEVKANPYKFICDWMEDVLPFTGRKAYEILAVMPTSIIIPDIDYEGERIRSNINMLLLTASGGGKSTIAKHFSNISYIPLNVESITPAKLERMISSNPMFTLIVGDFSRLARDPVGIKIIEGILGEEKRVHRATMRSEIDTATNGIGLFCGTSQDLSSYLTGGFIFRAVPLILTHNADEHSKIGEKIINNMGVAKASNGKEEVIKEYYQELFNIQGQDPPHPKQVRGYHIKKEFRKKAFDVWDNQTKHINKVLNAEFNWFRELHEFFRFLINHAFLNIHNREVKDGLLIPNEKDFTVALRLMKQTLRLKFDIVSMEAFSKTISDLRDLKKIMESSKLSEDRKEILQNIVRISRGRLSK